MEMKTWKNDPNSCIWQFVIGLIIALLSIAVIALATSAADAQQLMEPDKLAAIRASLPILEDEEANEKLHSESLVLYSETEIPPAYQHQVGNGHTASTFHSPLYNLSGDPSDLPLGHGRNGGGNANVEFPWQLAPGGAHESPGVTSVKGFHLPKPAILYRRDLPGRIDTGNISQVYDWVFPEGTLFVEAIYQHIGTEDVCFEVRFRQKEGREWAVDVFRPFAEATELADALEEMGPGKYREEAISDLRADKQLPTRRLVDSAHNRERAFDASEQVYSLPMLVTDDVLQLLDRPFVSCVGQTFKGNATAPSNDTRYVNLVPPKYHATFVGSSRQACMNCHDSTLRHASEFENPRGWYGRVRGSSEGIFTWHPIAPSSIATNGAHRAVALRRSFIQNGWVQRLEGNVLPKGYLFTER